MARNEVRIGGHALRKTRQEELNTPRCDKTGKKKSTHAQALKEAKYLKYNKKYPQGVPVPYVCKHCHWWHVGNLE